LLGQAHLGAGETVQALRVVLGHHHLVDAVKLKPYALESRSRMT
jgi:hypothetical protein